MGKYLSFANGCVKRLKPLIADRTGIKLEEIAAKDSSAYPKFDLDYFSNNLMFVASDYLNTIFITERNYEKEQKPLSSIPRGVAHEISHLAHRALIKDELMKAKTRSRKSRLLNRYKESKSFREGFAEYMCLDNLIDVYDDEAFKEVVRRRNHVKSYKDFSAEELRYERGYKFFRKVLSIIGKDKVLQVARSPPISEIEVRMPLLYLLRRYPAKGIKNIPGYLTKSLRTKILKRIYGYAPLNF